MPQVKGASMVCGHDITVATTAGYTIEFKADVPQYVPPLAVQECLKVGARELKRFTNTKTTVPNTKFGNIRSHVNVNRQDEEVVEEDVLPEHDVAPKQTAPKADTRNEKVYGEADQRVRQGILAMLEDSKDNEWTNAGVPAMAALQRRVKDLTVTSPMRDRVWTKMEEAGEIPEDYAEVLGL